MKEYERLTNNNSEEYNPEYDFCIGCKHFGEPNGCNRPNGTCSNYECFIETYNRLAEFEDDLENGELVSKEWHDEQVIHAENELQEYRNKIENGTLIELPCKVGDNIYFETWEDNGNTSIGVKGHKVAGFEINAIINGKYGKTYIPIKAVGIDVFLTKAEAEAKLKELQNER